jgi:hypothetical protein
LLDRPPPSRFSVVERRGRLVVIDKETGTTPLSAAERMDLHDRSLGVAPTRPAKPDAAPDMSAAARAESGLSARPAPARQSAAPAPADGGKTRMATAITERSPRPWKQPDDRPALKAACASAPSAGRPAPAAGGGGKTIVTGKWWDAKGPRTITLGPSGQAELSGGVIALFFMAAVAAIVIGFISLPLLFVGSFLLMRFGGRILAPVGARIIDKAMAEKG